MASDSQEHYVCCPVFGTSCHRRPPAVKAGEGVATGCGLAWHCGVCCAVVLDAGRLPPAGGGMDQRNTHDRKGHMTFGALLSALPFRHSCCLSRHCCGSKPAACFAQCQADSSRLAHVMGHPCAGSSPPPKAAGIALGSGVGVRGGEKDNQTMCGIGRLLLAFGSPLHWAVFVVPFRALAWPFSSLLVSDRPTAIRRT